MPQCPKCCNKLVKRSDHAYHCKRHGWVRDIQTPYAATLWDGKDVVMTQSNWKPKLKMESKMNQTFVIESGVEIPPAKTIIKAKTFDTFPFLKMKEGQSFTLPLKKRSNGQPNNAYLYQYAKKCGVKITVRQEGANIRVWRTK